jgi:hypothetical protein
MSATKIAKGLGLAVMATVLVAGAYAGGVGILVAISSGWLL